MIQAVKSLVHSGSDERKKWALLQLMGTAILLAALLTLVITSVADATSPTEGTEVPTAIATVGTVTAGTPFSSGQMVNVVIPANSLFVDTTNLQLVECSAPGGVIPTLSSACDGLTIQGVTLKSKSDGSVNLQTETGFLYELYALPDAVSLGEGSSGPPCDLTTQCILYIGNNYNDFTQNHVWSAPFYIAPNADDGGENPGDGSPPVVSTVPTVPPSTAVASPVTATADGVNASTVTVTLEGSNGTGVAGKAVTLTSASTTAKIVGPSPTLTPANGQVTFAVSDTVPETVDLTATDTTDSVTVTPTPTNLTVNFEKPVVTDADSIITASPTTVTTPGASTTITVDVADQTSGGVPNQTVTVHGTGSAAVVPATTGSNVTNANGIATFTATDTAAEVVTFTATDTSVTPSLTLTDTATVAFGSLVVSPAQSTVVATTPAPLNGGGSQVTVTLLTANGSPVSGQAVTLSSTSKTTTIGAPSPSLTGSNGEIIFTVTDSVPETVTLSAVDTTSTPSTSITATANVVFASPAPSPTASTVTAGEPTVVADGQTLDLVTVTLNTQFEVPVSDAVVTLATTGSSGNVEVHPIQVNGSGTAGTTNSAGVAEFETDDTTAEMVTFTASVTGGITVTQTASITFTAGPANPGAQGSTVVASPVNPPSDGTTPSTLVVTLTDAFGNPVAGQSISLAALNGKATINPVAAIKTNNSGQATFTATDATAEVVTFQATDVSDSNTPLTSEAVVTFGNPTIPPPVATFCSVAASATTVPADGTSTSTISVLLYNGDGDAVPGKTVTLAASGGSATVTAVNATSNNSGNALFTVSDTKAESVTFTAEDTTDSVDLTNVPVTVQFTNAGPTTTTTTSPSTTTTTTSRSTTTTTSPGTTTTTEAPAAQLTSGGGSADSGGSSSGGGDSSSLAFTGVSPLLAWIGAIGFLFMGIGTVGRRHYRMSSQ